MFARSTRSIARSALVTGSKAVPPLFSIVNSTSKVRLRDSSGGAREIEREVFELEDRDLLHAAIIEARRSSCLAHAEAP